MVAIATLRISDEAASTGSWQGFTEGPAIAIGAQTVSLQTPMALVISQTTPAGTRSDFVSPQEPV